MAAAPRIVLYIATSLDGCIATADGGVDWLGPYSDALGGFTEFTSGIGVSVMGRKTYEFFRKFAPPSGADAPTHVLTHRPLGEVPKGVRAYEGDVAGLAARVRQEAALLEGTARDIWLIGGGEVVAAFHAAGEIDLYRLFVLPVTLGAGIRLFPAGPAASIPLRLVRTQTFPSGVVELAYERVSGHA